MAQWKLLTETITEGGFVVQTSPDLELLQVVADAAREKLAQDPVAINVSQRLPFADVFFIASADNERQVQAITDEIVDQVNRSGRPRPKVEGREGGAWVLIDCGDVVAHVMDVEQREFYALERLWADCPQIPLEPSDRAACGA